MAGSIFMKLVWTLYYGRINQTSNVYFLTIGYTGGYKVMDAVSHEVRR
jgi:mannose/fructose/N-acetylgalactosamine-specific phosphotransferase system component IID